MDKITIMNTPLWILLKAMDAEPNQRNEEFLRHIIITMAEVTPLPVLKTENTDNEGVRDGFDYENKRAIRAAKRENTDLRDENNRQDKIKS